MNHIHPTNTSAQQAAGSVPRTVELGVGTVQVYSFGAVSLHAYQTNDPIDNQCYLVETDTELVGIESPAFHANLTEYAQYIQSLGKPMKHLLLAYHPSGADHLTDAVKLVTDGAAAAMREGGSVRNLIDGFVSAFGSDFDGTVPAVTRTIEPGTIRLGGLDFLITEGLDGFDIEIPAIRCVFTHMVGSDVHNIMPSIAAMDALAAQMQRFLDRGYALILTSHYVPETLDAARIKLAYVRKMKELAQSCSSAEAFLSAARAAFPRYSGANYLEMTAAGLYR